jgi:hypothetical protein
MLEEKREDHGKAKCCHLLITKQNVGTDYKISQKRAAADHFSETMLIDKQKMSGSAEVCNY